jgi:hypothetical protein
MVDVGARKRGVRLRKNKIVVDYRNDIIKLYSGLYKLSIGIWIGKVFQRMKQFKKVLLGNNNSIKSADIHYKKYIISKYWKVLCNKNLRTSIWVIAGRHKVLTQRAKAISRCLRIWIDRYRRLNELNSMSNYIRNYRCFSTFIQKINMQLNRRLIYSRADLRYKTNQLNTFIRRLLIYSKRSISIRRNFKEKESKKK